MTAKKQKTHNIIFSATDYGEVELLTVIMAPMVPGKGMTKILNPLGTELSDVENIRISLDEKTGIYEIEFVHNGKHRHATLINVELKPCTNTMT